MKINQKRRKNPWPENLVKLRLRKNNQIIHMPLQIYDYHQFTIDECKITVILIVEVFQRGVTKKQ